MPETVKYTPFGTRIRKIEPQDCSNKFLAQFGLELDKETGSTSVVVKDPIDLDAQIQTYKDQCGMELAQLEIRRGLASPDDFAAAPGDYGDTSTLPDNINDAYRASLDAKQAAAGLDLNQFKTDADIEAYVKAQVKAQLEAQAKAHAQTTEVKDNA